MKRVGFTLAEVLITLGIIGVIAALTTPALVKNSGQAKIGPSLAKFVNTFETGIEQMMHEGKLYSLKNNVGGYMMQLSKYVIMSPITLGDDEDAYTFTDAAGTKSYDFLSMEKDIKDCILGKASGCTDFNGDGSISGLDHTRLIDYRLSTTTWQLKDGSIVEIIPLRNFTESQKGAYQGIVAEVIVDIDGNKGQNKAGKDVFAFLLDGSGVLIPVGSSAHKFIEQNGEVYITSFSNECKTDSSLINNFACTGKIADSNWNAKY